VETSPLIVGGPNQVWLVNDGTNYMGLSAKGATFGSNDASNGRSRWLELPNSVGNAGQVLGIASVLNPTTSGVAADVGQLGWVNIPDTVDTSRFVQLNPTLPQDGVIHLSGEGTSFFYNLEVNTMNVGSTLAVGALEVKRIDSLSATEEDADIEIAPNGSVVVRLDYDGLIPDEIESFVVQDSFGADVFRASEDGTISGKGGKKLIRGVTRRESSSIVATGGCLGLSNCVQASCSVDEIVLGGGCTHDSTSSRYLWRSYPYSDSSWVCQYNYSASTTITAYAICATQ
ncbi:MAG: hypothetical protein ABIG71_01585, partial [Candidatus Uhrbacteria bacterium]